MTAPALAKPQLIHVAKIFEKGKWSYLYLHKEEQQYTWFKDGKPTQVTSVNIEEAILNANRHWKMEKIAMLNCGFRYQQPERDEHGMNALFYQMVLGYSSSNGIYFDPILAGNFLVQFASQEALQLWKTLEKNGK